jgi:hypothetical protein
MIAVTAAVVTALALGAAPSGGANVPRGANYEDVPHATEALFAGHATVARVFDSNEVDEWDTYPGAVRAYSQGVRTFVFSWKGARLDSIREFAATVPDDVKIYGTYWHEPEDDVKRGTLKLANWKSTMVAQSAVMREEGIIPIRILMGWTLFPAKSARRVADYDLPAGTISVAAFDGHVRAKDPTRMARKLAKEQKRSGLPTAVPETSGAPGHLRTFLTTLKKLKVKPRFVCYFSTTGIKPGQSRVMFGVPD